MSLPRYRAERCMARAPQKSMRSIIGKWMTGGLLAFAAGSGCADLDSEGQGGRGGAAGAAGDGAIDVSASGGSSGEPSSDGGPDAADSGASDSDVELDAAAATASCKAAADGAACTTCACERCIEYISACNKNRRCRSVLDCAAQSGCKHTQQCFDMCRDVIFAAEDDVYYASMASECRAAKCATECRGTDVDAHVEDGSPDAADGKSSDAEADAEVDAALDSDQE